MQAVLKAFSLCLSFLLGTCLLQAQTANISTNGGNTPTTPAPSELSEGGHTSNVNLFTGTLQTSYDLGTVSSPSGLSFSASLGYSSNFVVGTEAPHLVGVPYGEGWSLALPTVSVKTEDFNKFTQSQLNVFSNGTGSQPFTSTFNTAAEVALEGQQFDYAFHFSVPGVASGRLVYKYFKDGEAIFVPHTFDQYLEARYKPGEYWHIHLHDGTVYELNFVNVVTIAGANQRTKMDFQNPNLPSNFELPINADPHNVLPSTQVGTWYCTKKTSKNLTGEINFYYNSYGCLDYFTDENDWNFPNNRISNAYLNLINYNAVVPKACSDVIISSIESESERLLFNYSYNSSNLGGTTGSNLLPPNTATRLDEMYYKSVVNQVSSAAGFAPNWKRYLHVMSNEAQNLQNGCSNDNINQFLQPGSNFDPYKGNRPPNNLKVGRIRRPMGTNGLFGHAFIESPGILLSSLPIGDRYEITAALESEFTNECLFDFNVVAGQNVSACSETITTANIAGVSSGSSTFDYIDGYRFSRSTTIFSTFHNQLKSISFTGTTAKYYFTLPSLPAGHTQLFVQIGPAVSDIDHRSSPVSVTGSNEFQSLRAYYTRKAIIDNNYDNSALNLMRSGERYTPGAFGIGLPYYTFREFYGGNNLDLGNHASPSNNKIWWQDCPVIPSSSPKNRPTAAWNDQSSAGSKIKSFSLTRISKVPYVLSSVEKQIFSPNPDGQGYKSNNQWITASSLTFQYEIKQVDRLVYIINNATPNPIASSELNGKRNSVLLKSITNNVILNSTVGYNHATAPKTQFNYFEMIGNAEVNSGLPDIRHEKFQYRQNVLTSIITPLGKQESILYYPINTGTFSSISGQQNFSFTVLTSGAEVPFDPLLREDNTASCTMAWESLKRPISGLNLELNLLVDSISIVDAYATKGTKYTYSDLVFFNGTPSLGNTNWFDTQFKRAFEEVDADVRYGFKSTTVKGPKRVGPTEADNVRVTSIYFHKTNELPEALLWGKLYKEEVWFADMNNFNNNLLYSRKESEYEAWLAYENIWHRGRNQNVGFDYEDYYTGQFVAKSANSLPRPILPFAPIQSATNPNFSTYYNNIHTYYGLGVDHTGTPNSEHAHISHLNFDASNQGKYGTFDLTNNYLPTFYNSVYLFANGIIGSDAALRKFSFLDETSRPHMCNSYFVKKTKETNESFDFNGTITASTGTVTVSSTLRNSIKTITEYKYFDADYVGRSNSPGYKEMGLALQSDGFYHLYWEPSWQLYSKLTYSPDMHAVIDSSYNKEEFFYYYDLANVPAYQQNNSGANYKLKSNDRFGAIHRAWAFGQLRNIMYETRKSNKVLGSAQPIIKSEYMIYSDGWESPSKRDVVDWNKVAQNDWPTDPTTDRAIVAQGGLSSPDTRFCSYSNLAGTCALSGITPAVYCPCTGFGVLTAAIDASLTLGSTNPFNDIDYRLRQKFSLKGKFLLDRIVNQISTPTVSPSPAMRFNTSGDPIFAQGAQTVTSLTINRRNHFGQISLQTDAKGLITETVFPQIKAVEMKRFVNKLRVIDVMYLNSNLGMPSSVIYGKSDPDDEQTTAYLYFPENSVKQVTDPNGTQMNYTYDYFGRLHETKRGTTLLSKVTYGNYSNTNSLTFKDRAAQNWVKTETYFGSEFNAGTLTDAILTEVQHIDPLGRKVMKYRYNQFANNFTVLEDILFDTWNTPSVGFKPKVSTTAPAPTVQLASLPTTSDTYTHSYHYTTPDSRVWKSYKYGNIGLAGKFMEMKYFYFTKAQLSSLLTSTATGLTSLAPLGERFLATWTKDEDNKANIIFQDALGQTVSTIVIDNATSTASYAATLVQYNEFGQPRNVVNPKNQRSDYYYNYFGKLFKKVTVDEGTNEYAYNLFGELVATRDAKTVVRVLTYDKFGRQLTQARSTLTTGFTHTQLFANSGMLFGTSTGPYFDIINNPANYVFEKRTFYKNLNSWYSNHTHANAVTLINTATNRKGRPAMTMAYSPNGAVIEAKYFSYNADGFVQWEINQFNYNGITPTAKGLVFKTEYPAYQRLGSPKRIMVDLDVNGTQEFQYAMNYDSYGRLACVKSDLDPVPVTANFKIAEFAYNDAAGKVSIKKYFDHHPTDFNCKDKEVETVTYTYDKQFRVTDILATLFDWQLKYDGLNFGNHTTGTSTNYNGNVNSTFGNYKFSSISPAISTFAGAESGTYYNYQYDKYNRLINADAKVGSQTTTIGDEIFAYDKIGNITSATRTSTDFSPTPTLINSTFSYGATNNRLSSVSYGANPTRSFTYDFNGNLTSDTKSTLTSAIYNRGNTLASALTTTGNIAYLYNTSDSRVFKHKYSGLRTDNLDYYLKSSSGLDLAVFNMKTNKLNWYVYGANSERVAQVPHPSTTIPNANKTGESDIKVELADESIWDELKTADFFDEKFVYEVYPEHPVIHALLRLQDRDGKLLIPNILYVATDEKGNAQKAFLATDEGLDLSDYKFIDTIPIDGLHTPIAIRSEPVLLPGTQDDYYEAILIVKPGEILGLIGQDGKGEKKPDLVEMEGNVQARALAPTSAPQPIFYLNDHLGNTRVTFHTDVCTNGTTITRYIDHAIDYYPYGKMLRQYFSPTPERYLTTQHERDTETSYDNRGARLYDADVMRFLSVDPFSAEYKMLSSYSYVGGNPIILVDRTGKYIEFPDISEHNKSLVLQGLNSYFGADIAKFQGSELVFDIAGKGLLGEKGLVFEQLDKLASARDLQIKMFALSAGESKDGVDAGDILFDDYNHGGVNDYMNVDQLSKYGDFAGPMFLFVMFEQAIKDSRTYAIDNHWFTQKDLNTAQLNHPTTSGRPHHDEFAHKIANQLLFKTVGVTQETFFNTRSLKGSLYLNGKDKSKSRSMYWVLFSDGTMELRNPELDDCN